MTSLFISYSRKDIEFARKLTDIFKAQELDFWIDWEGIPPTVDWWNEIQKGIEEADIFLVLLSPDSCKSKVCRQEIKHAVRNGKRLIPVVARGVNAKEVPAELGALNWIFLREDDDFYSGFSKLMVAIKTDYNWVKIHRQLQVKALDWERNDHESSWLLRGKELSDAEAQLATNSSKEPSSTHLQREYISESRRVFDKQRKTSTSILAAGLIVIGVLIIFGFVQNERALQQANARATAQANTDIQRNIALARQLTAKARTMSTPKSSKQMIAVLLAVKSVQLFPSVDAVQLLQDSSLTRSIVRKQAAKSVSSVAFSLDGQYIVVGGSDCEKNALDIYGTLCKQGSASVWEARTGKEITKLTYDGPVAAVAFSPNGRNVLSSACEKVDASQICAQGLVQIWEALTGKEIAHITYSGNVSSVELSPDGEFVVLGRTDGIAQVWKIKTGKEISRVNHNGPVRSVEFSPDGKYVVSGSSDGSVQIWQVTDGKEITQISDQGEILVVRFSSDSKYIVSGGCKNRDAVTNFCTGGSVKVWDAGTGEEIARMKHEGDVTAVAFSPDGKYVASGSSDETACAWEAITGKEVARMKHEGGVTSVAFTPDGQYVVSGSKDGTARVWESVTGTEVLYLQHDSDVTSIAISPDGRYILSGSVGGTASIWGLENSKKIIHMRHDGLATSVAVSPDGEYIVSGSDDQTARVWELTTGTEIARLIHDETISSVAFSPDGKYIVSGSDDQTARVWELTTGTEIARLIHSGSVSSVAFSPNGQYILTASTDKTARVWDAKTGMEIARMTHQDEVTSIAFSLDSKFVVSKSIEATIVWETSRGKEITRSNHAGFGSSVAFRPDGKFVVSANNMFAHVWDAFTGQDLFQVRHDRDVTHVSFSPDGRYVLSGALDGTARVSEAATGKTITILPYDGRSSVAFSPDSQYVLAGRCGQFDNATLQCIQGAVHIWRITTGEEIDLLQHSGNMFFATFSASGKYILTASSDGTARLWMWRPDEIIEAACSRVERNLTNEEWMQYVGGDRPYQEICPDLSRKP